MMGGDCRIDEVAGASEPAVADKIGEEDRCELSGVGQLRGSGRREIYHNIQRNTPKFTQARQPKADCGLLSPGAPTCASKEMARAPPPR
jgi:hypothetical protein